MANYYSQHGEDYLLDLIFPDKNDGFFVEIGCIDGIRFSNTLYFEEKGWKGLCVEAHPDYIPLIQKNRPNSIVCHYAVGEQDEDDAVFYANDRGSLSTLDKSQEARWKKDFPEYFHGFEEKHVAKRTLTSIFKEHGVGHINILSLDIEGYEVPALQGLDLGLYQPDVLVIEADGVEEKKQQEEILSTHGYFFAVSLAGNNFYVRDEELAVKVRNIVATVPVVQSKHPLDSGDDILIQRKIDTRVRKTSWQAKVVLKIKKIFSRFTLPKQNERPISPFFDVGFHGDKYLLEFAGHLLKDANLFIETGTNVGTTLDYVARTFPHLRCISCEPDLSAFTEAVRHTNNLPNVFLFNESSQQFVGNLHARFGTLLDGHAVFWLDAHGYGFKWPLREEIAFITSHFDSAYILIDDFLVPGMEMFQYDRHGDQVCSLDYIRNSLQAGRQYNVYYPAYTDHTSPHHPLRGWGLISYGNHEPTNLPANLKDKVRMEKENR